MSPLYETQTSIALQRFWGIGALGFEFRASRSGSEASSGADMNPNSFMFIDMNGNYRYIHFIWNIAMQGP